jgi:hypothetical protein
MTMTTSKKTTAKKTKVNTSITLSTQELYNFLNNKLWIVSDERLQNTPPEAIHKIKLQSKFVYQMDNSIFLIPLSSVISFTVKGEAIADTLQHIFGIPAGMIDASKGKASKKGAPEEMPPVSFQEESSRPLQQFRRFRRALLYAFVWHYKHAELKKQDSEQYLQELFRRLDAEHLTQMPLLNSLATLLAQAPHPPATFSGNSLEASSVHVQRWYWFAQFLRDQLFNEEGKMDEAHRQWYLQFKSTPYRIEKDDIPPLFTPLYKIILGYLLFLRIYDAASPQDERRIFEQELRQAYRRLPYNELEQIYLYALLFKGFFVRQADNYFIASSGRHVFAYLEYQALLLAQLTTQDKRKQKALLSTAIKELLQAQQEENLATHLLAYYEGLNPLLKKRGATWLNELWHTLNKDKAWENLTAEERQQVLAALNQSLRKQKQVLLIRNNALSWFFRHCYIAVAWKSLQENSLLFYTLPPKKWPLPEKTVNLLHFTQEETNDASLYGDVQLSHPQTAGIYSTKAGIEQLQNLELFHPKRLQALSSLLPQAKVLFIAIDNYLLSHIGQLWLAHWIEDVKPEKVICINLTTASPWQQQASLFDTPSPDISKSTPKQKKKGSTGKQAPLTSLPSTPAPFADEDEKKLQKEMILRRQLQKLHGKEVLLYHLNLSEENYELIRLLRPLLKKYRWYESALIYMGHQQPIPFKLADGLLRAQSDLIVYDEQMRYMFYNL